MDELTWQPAGEHLVAARVGTLAVVRIDRADKLNALSPAMLPDLAVAIRGHAATADGLVLTGTGRAFSAGDDLDATADLDRDGFEALIAGFQDLTRAVLETDVPVIAAVNGLAVGGAAELTLACDARIGAPDAFLLFPENSLGLTISNGSTYLLPRALRAGALPLILDGGRIEADEALRLGLLTDVADDPLAAAIARMRRWTASTAATRWHLRMLRPDRAAVEAAMRRETEIALEVFGAGIATTGAAAFRDRAR
ncbi:MAG TPA: enoyl-CoA hydratase/isomerase family protein [Euzebyales bacterium]|nr:enoyl-CoA hydratase/isomerase family protein [Euzebyales bacterium]